MMAEYRGVEIEGTVPMRCNLCGDQIGLVTPPQPPPEVLDARCYACAALEEAEKITAEAT